jgi:hypothetical protein
LKKIDLISPATQRKSVKTFSPPAFIKVRRAVLKLAGPRVALAEGFIRYRASVGACTNGVELEALFCWGGAAGCRAFKDLRELGLMDANDALVKGAISDEGGFLKVSVAAVRELGDFDACVLVQLLTFGQLRMAQFVGGQLVVRARGLAALMGCHVDTALASLKRLSTGLTTKVKALLRKGAAAIVKPRLELFRAAGRAMRVRLLGEREREQLAVKTAKVVQPPARSSAESVPSREELAQMLRAATRQRGP